MSLKTVNHFDERRLDLAGPLAARAVFTPPKNIVTGRLIMMNGMYFMLLVLCFQPAESFIMS